MTLSNKKKRRSRTGRTIKCYCSDHPEDTEEPKQFIERAILADKVKAHDHLIDIINILLLGIRENESSRSVRCPANSCAIPNDQYRRSLAAALMFGREDWLGSHIWASAAQRVGQAW